MSNILIIVFCNLSPRSFFPGSSFFFWLLIAIVFYLFYLYSSSKNKQDFIKSPYILSVSIALLLFFIAYLSINMFLSEPPRKYVVEEKEISLKERIDEDLKMSEEVENNFLNPLLHEKYIDNHYKIEKSWKIENGDFRDRDDISIYNFYLDKLESVAEEPYLDNARWGLGLIHYQKKSFYLALKYFNEIKEPNFPILNFYKGKIYLDEKDTLQAIAYFRSASKIKDQFQVESTEYLISLLEAKQNDQELFNLLNQEIYKPYFSFSLATRLYFLNNRIVEYYTLMLKYVFRDFKWTGFISALIILLAWGFFMIRMDIFEKENKLIMFLVLLTGMVFTVGCYYFYDYLKYYLDFEKQESNLLMYCIFGIGFVEELIKIIPLLLLLLVARRVINEPYDYILYAALSALGFSFMENLMYFDGNLHNVIHGRALTSVPGHIINSSIVAYGFVLSRYRYNGIVSVLVIPAFFLLGMINHGLYDYWIFAEHSIMFIIGFLLSVSFWIIIINNSLNNSPTFNYQIVSKPHSRQLILSISLLSILVMEYIVVAWERGPMFANANFNSSLIFGGIMITYYSSRLSNIDLVKGYWGGLPFKTINEKRSDAEFDFRNFLVRILSGDTFTHSFVNHEVILQTTPENEKLYSHFNTSVKGIICDRLVVTCKSAKGNQYEDPFFFRIETTHPIEVGGGMEQTFLFRFEEARPSFENSQSLAVYLFALRSKDDLHGKLSRENLRALGKAIVKR